MSDQRDIDAETVTQLREVLERLEAEGLGGCPVEYVDTYSGTVHEFVHLAIYARGQGQGRAVQLS